MIITYVFLAAFMAGIIVSSYMLVRVRVAYRNQMRVCDAIYMYNLRCIRRGVVSEVYFDDMEDYSETVYRLFDFGCERILPPEKYLIIKPFLEKSGK